jgi:predicted kinase
MENNILNVEITKPLQVVVIMRGIPGSGKSTEAKKLVGEGIIHSTDDLIEVSGDYRVFFEKMFESKDFTPLSRMHSQNLKNFIQSIKEGKSPIIVDNTNIRQNEAKAYVKKALELGISETNIKIVDIGTNGLTAEELAERNTHGVPIEKIRQMIASHKGQGELTIKKILESKNMYKESDVLYSCVLLDTASRTKLLSMIGGEIPQDWTVIAHHMTITLGELKDKSDIGKNVILTVTDLGMSEMAMAVKVTGYETKNAIAHITIAINPDGGKPMMSNQITKWQNIKPFMVSGTVTEIKRQ